MPTSHENNMVNYLQYYNMVNYLQYYYEVRYYKNTLIGNNAINFCVNIVMGKLQCNILSAIVPGDQLCDN